ncbi:hypothetical protein RJ55_07290 [Drechmeria coniospora]|nr:hypothetical protein RJ55_07290 [Drechmeria coniospora]
MYMYMYATLMRSDEQRRGDGGTVEPRGRWWRRVGEAAGAFLRHIKEAGGVGAVPWPRDTAHNTTLNLRRHVLVCMGEYYFYMYTCITTLHAVISTRHEDDDDKIHVHSLMLSYHHESTRGGVGDLSRYRQNRATPMLLATEMGMAMGIGPARRRWQNVPHSAVTATAPSRHDRPQVRVRVRAREITGELSTRRLETHLLTWVTMETATACVSSNEIIDACTRIHAPSPAPPDKRGSQHLVVFGACGRHWAALERRTEHRITVCCPLTCAVLLHHTPAHLNADVSTVRLPTECLVRAIAHQPVCRGANGGEERRRGGREGVCMYTCLYTYPCTPVSSQMMAIVASTSGHGHAHAANRERARARAPPPPPPPPPLARSS